MNIINIYIPVRIIINEYESKTDISDFFSNLPIHTKTNQSIIYSKDVYSTHQSIWKQVSNDPMMIIGDITNVKWVYNIYNVWRNSFININDYDLLILGHTDTGMLNSNALQIRENPFVSSHEYKYKTLKDVTNLGQLPTSYIISPSGAKKLLDRFKKEQVDKRSPDLSTFFKNNINNINIHILTDPLYYISFPFGYDVMVINLKRRTDRLQEFYDRWLFSFENVTIFEAVDGKALDMNHLELKNNCALTPGITHFVFPLCKNV